MKRLSLAIVLLCVISATAMSQTITVISPNGGENWALGSTQGIKWTSSGMTGNVRILLFKGGASLGIIKDDVPVAAGSINWVVGAYQGGMAVPGTDYKVRIRKMQTEILDASNREFTISPAVVTPPPVTPPPSGSITVSNPNGGETWRTGTAYEVRWTAANIAGNVTIKVKKGGAAVKTWSAANTGSSYWMCTGIADGTDYRVRVESGDGVVFDESDRNFEIKSKTVSTPPSTALPPAISAVAVEPAPVQMRLKVPPEILDFRLNDGAERTDNGVVTMNHTVRGTPTHYRWKNERMPDWSPWIPYGGAAPPANLPEACGSRTIRFQLKNNDGESNVAEDTIRYFFYRDVKINAAEAKGFCGSDWTFEIMKRDCLDLTVSACAEIANTDGGAVSCALYKVQLPEVPIGYTAEFLIFAGRFLKEGWSFVSSEWRYMYRDWVTEAYIEAPLIGNGYTLLLAPSAGERGITHSIRLWIDGGQRGYGKFSLFSLTLRGPCDQPVSEAFR
jgi:hypothetical protein